LRSRKADSASASSASSVQPRRLGAWYSSCIRMHRQRLYGLRICERRAVGPSRAVQAPRLATGSRTSPALMLSNAMLRTPQLSRSLPARPRRGAEGTERATKVAERALLLPGRVRALRPAERTALLFSYSAHSLSTGPPLRNAVHCLSRPRRPFPALAAACRAAYGREHCCRGLRASHRRAARSGTSWGA